LWGEESKTCEKGVKQYIPTNKTSIKRVACIFPLEVVGLVAKHKPPEANGSLEAEAEAYAVQRLASL